MILGLSLHVDFQPIQFFRCGNKEVNSSSNLTGGPISLDFFFLPPPYRTPRLAVRQIRPVQVHVHQQIAAGLHLDLVSGLDLDLIWSQAETSSARTFVAITVSR
jgi:hypothetical protein